MTRREWIVAAAALAAPGGRRAGLGLQLYTVRNQMAKDPEATLRAIAGIGYREVEGGRAELLQVRQWLKQYKLNPVSCSIETPLVTGNWQAWQKNTPAMKQIGWDEALKSVKEIGARYVVLPYLLPPERNNFERLADQMNAAGEKCRAAGFQFCYHNHAFEFQGQPGQRPMDVFLKRMDPKLARLEVDVFWVSTAGNDPVEFLRSHADHITLVHLKDRRPGSPVQYNEAVPRNAFMEVGSGSLDFPAILKAVAAAGVEQCFVEQDQTPGDPLDSARKSFEYLRSLRPSALDI